MSTPDTEKPDERDYRVVIFMTRQDGEYLTRLAKECGFKKGRSQLIVALLERLIIGGFSGVVFFQLGLQFVKLRDKLGLLTGKEFYFGTRPLPALPVEPVSPKEANKAIQEIKEELTKPQNAKC